MPWKAPQIVRRDPPPIASIRSGKVDMSLRWVYVHMIEAYARHNGHADLLRERLDGAAGVLSDRP
jgi:hypothetical protein